MCVSPRASRIDSRRVRPFSAVKKGHVVPSTDTEIVRRHLLKHLADSRKKPRNPETVPS